MAHWEPEDERNEDVAVLQRDVVFSCDCEEWCEVQDVAPAPHHPGEQRVASSLARPRVDMLPQPLLQGSPPWE
jgi:hypothetical protein